MMDRASQTTVTFALAFAALLVAPAFLGRPFLRQPQVAPGDLIEIVTPFALVPLYWRLFRETGRAPARERAAGDGSGVALFVVLAALWAQGSGMHVAANAIGHAARSLQEERLVATIHFYDEVLSHWIWHGATVCLSALLMWREWDARAPGAGAEASPMAPLVVAGLVHGFSFFAIVVEGGTAALGVPFAAAAGVVGIARCRRSPRTRPITAFFAMSYVAATVLFAIWALRWGGLPEFSRVGIID